MTTNDYLKLSKLQHLAHLGQLLAEYTLEDESERQDYEEQCEENKWNPNLYDDEINNHIYALATEFMKVLNAK